MAFFKLSQWFNFLKLIEILFKVKKTITNFVLLFVNLYIYLKSFFLYKSNIWWWENFHKQIDSKWWKNIKLENIKKHVGVAISLIILFCYDVRQTVLAYALQIFAIFSTRSLERLTRRKSAEFPRFSEIGSRGKATCTRRRLIFERRAAILRRFSYAFLVREINASLIRRVTPRVFSERIIKIQQPFLISLL